MTHARPLYSSVCTPCHAGCWRQTHHSTCFRKSQLIAASGPGAQSILSAPCQAYVISWLCHGKCSVQTLSSLVVKNWWMIPQQRLCKAEQKHSSGKVSWANSLWKKKWDQIFLCKFWSSPVHLGSFHKVLHFYWWVCDRQLRPLTALSVSLFLIPMYTPDVLPGLLLIAVWSPFLNMAFRTPDSVLVPRKQVNACHWLEEKTIFQDYLFILFCGEIHNTIEWDS